MAKYITPVIILGIQVVGRAFSRSLPQEYAATQATTQRGKQRSPKEAKFNVKKMGMRLEDTSFLLSGSCGHRLCQDRYFSQLTFNDVFSDSSKEQFIKSVEKMKAMSFKTTKYTRDASVMVPLCRVNGEPSVLLTMRSITMGRNKGDASFPGGMKEIADKDAIDVALRETQEEIGTLTSIEVWAVMPPMPTRTGEIKVIPVVTFIGDVCLEEYSVNKDEVEYVFALTLDCLCNPKNWYYTQYKVGYTLPVYVVDKYRIWGLTAAILHYTLKMLLPEYYTQNLPWGCNKLQANNKD